MFSCSGSMRDLVREACSRLNPSGSCPLGKEVRTLELEGHPWDCLSWLTQALALEE